MWPFASRAMVLSGSFFVTCVAAGCRPAPPASTGADVAKEPPLTQVATTPQDLDVPFASLAEMSDQERLIIVDYVRGKVGSGDNLRVTLLPSAVEVCVPQDRRKQIAADIIPLFQLPREVSVTSGCRGVTALSARGLGPGFLKPQYASDGNANLEAVWSALINSFSAVCDAEVNSAAMHSEQAGRAQSFESYPRRVPSSARFSGIIIKEVIKVSLRDAAIVVGATAARKEVFVSVESDIFWRRASATEWVKVSTLQQLDPAMLADEAGTTLARCAKGLVGAIGQ